MVGGWHPAEQVDAIAHGAVQVMPAAQALGSAFTPKAEGMRWRLPSLRAAASLLLALATLQGSHPSGV